jgi:hypothetical protein
MASSASFRQAVSRIKGYLSLEKLRALSFLCMECAELHKILQAHECKQVKLPRPPKPTQQNKRRNAQPHTICHTPSAGKGVSVLPKTSPEGESGLTPGRVKGWALKEIRPASRHLGRQTASKQSSLARTVTPFVEEDVELAEKRAQKEAWQDFIKSKEERHYHITRITKILSD